jgi:hypothetical protein
MSETLNELPPVAKSFHTFCKKCNAERYHTVVAHTTKSSAKLKCEICGASSTYKLPKAAKVPGAKRPLTGAAAKRKEAAASAKKNAHSAEYSELMNNSEGDTVSYTMKGNFSANTKLKHPKFGTGYVRVAQQDKIEVVFEDEVRNLVHNRG